MSSLESQTQGSINYRPRRCHQKSRTGCRECKRRRIKCDEKKPSCTRCMLRLESCVYHQAAALFAVESGHTDELPLPSPQRPLSLSPMAQSFSDNTPLSNGLACSTSALMEAPYSIKAEEDSLSLSDTALYHHYLQHTSHISTHYHNDKTVLAIYIPTLALQSNVVFHSILALSAACLCRDMIAKLPPPDLAAVNEVLMTGYRHYNLASEKTRDIISQPNTLRPEPLLASAPFLIGFATASQQIHHWIESRKSTREPSKLLFASLRDTIIIIKGLRTTIQVLRRDHVSSSHKMAYEPEVPNEIMLSKPPQRTPPPSHTHVMYPIFAATSQKAFSMLQERLDSVSVYHGEDASWAACAEAFQKLSTIRNQTFSSCTPSTPLSLDNASMLPQLPVWLRSYIGRPTILLPNEPLIRPFLTFLTGSSQEYLDLLLPLLDESLESPIESVPDGSPELTEVQALALDIWAHWCVLMFLVEEEAWWIGNLPFILLTGMLNRYGDDFVARLWPGDDQGKSRWWPASILACLREVKQCQ